MLGQRKIAALVAEFLGTFVLASAVLSMVSRTQFPFFPAFVAGLVLMVVVLTLGAVSGAHINPAVTIALWTQKKVQTTEMLVYVAAQLLGGLAAWRVGEWLLDVTMKNAYVSTVDWRVVVAEGLGALVFAVGIAAALERGYDGAKQAVAIGFSLTLGILVASLGGAGIVNPAVAIGINTVGISYLVGPVVGAVLGMTLYNYLLAPVPAKASKKRK